MPEGKSGGGLQGVEAKGDVGTFSAIGSASGAGMAHGVGAAIFSTVGSTVTVTAEVIRAPFSEAGMAERFAADPEFYRNLAVLAGSALRREAKKVDGVGNLGATTKSQLDELADSFEKIASGLDTAEGVLTPKAAAIAAALVTKLRATYAAIVESNPPLLKIATIGFAAYVLHHFGDMSGDLAGLLTYAVINKEKLSETLKSWKAKKD